MSGELNLTDVSLDDGGKELSSQYGSVVQLNPKLYDEKTGKPVPWWKKRKQKIFRKKTLIMRVPVLQWLPKYNGQDFFADLVAGITVGVTVIPQGLAYAAVAGLPPQYGLYSAYMGCFIYMVLGSARPITIGPTALLSLVTYDGVALMGPGAGMVLSFFTGIICLIIGLLNFGFVIEFISAPVIAGFTSGAAFTIATTQVKSLLGLKFDDHGFLDTWIQVFQHISETRLWDAVMGFSCIVLLLLLRLLDRVKVGDKENPTRIQNIINRSFWFISVSRNAIIIIIATIIASALSTPGEENPFTITGNITSGLPPFEAPPFYIEYENKTFNFGEICQNLGSSIVLTPLVAILESVSIAKAFSKGQRLDASQEMIAIGTSNFLGSFVASYPVTGSFSRTAVNNSSGVRTPFGGIYTGALVLLAITVLTPYFYYIPKSALAAVIICAVIFMVEVHMVKLVWLSRKLDLIPFVITFLCCVFISLEIGILIGAAVHLSMLLYATARPRILIVDYDKPMTPKYLSFTPDRSLVFTAMDYFMKKVRKASALFPGVPVVIDMSYVCIADFTTAYSFDNLSADLHKKGHVVILTKTEPRILKILMGLEPKVHVHHEGADLKGFLEEVTAPPVVSIENKDVLPDKVAEP